MAHADPRLSRLQLTAMVVGSMVGAGIFSLPRTFAEATGPQGAIVAWLVAATGMYALARVFQALAERKPELDAGVFAYARAGFGDYPGFLSAFGYWISACSSLAFYWVLIASTLAGLLPLAGEKHPLLETGIASAGVWLFHVLILRGVRQAAVLNTVVTVSKLVPLLVFVVVLALAFQADRFRLNLDGSGLAGGLFAQLRTTMLLTVFVFIGIEGASVYSRYARERADVGYATTLGFLGVTALMVLVTLLPYAVLPRAETAAMNQPSMPAVFAAVVGPWGAVFISTGLLVSVLGAYLAWSLICAEVLFMAAKTGVAPSVFARENANKVPVNALWLSSGIVQLLVIGTYWAHDAFTLMINLTSSMALVPYLLVAGYGWLLAWRRETYALRPSERNRDLALGGIAVAYASFMIYAGGLVNLLLTAILYAPGTVLYVRCRREQGQKVFTAADWVLFLAAVVGAVAGVHGLATGRFRL